MLSAGSPANLSTMSDDSLLSAGSPANLSSMSDDSFLSAGSPAVSSLCRWKFSISRILCKCKVHVGYNLLSVGSPALQMWNMCQKSVYCHTETLKMAAPSKMTHSCPGSRKVMSSARSARSHLAILDPLQSKIYMCSGTT